jgi:hypothetical protein
VNLDGPVLGDAGLTPFVGDISGLLADRQLPVDPSDWTQADVLPVTHPGRLFGAADGAHCRQQPDNAGDRGTRAPSSVALSRPTGAFLTSSDRSETEDCAMLVELLHGVQWTDAAIARKSGPAYNAILGIGHVMEIVRRLREFGDLPTASAVRSSLAVLLFVLLLMQQLAQLTEHIDRRRHRARP